MTHMTPFIPAMEDAATLAAAAEQKPLDEALWLAKSRGLMGVVVIHQGGTVTPYVGATLDRNGRIGNQTWDTHNTPEAALEQLAKSLERV